MWESCIARYTSTAVAVLPLLGGVTFSQTRRAVRVPVSLLAIVYISRASGQRWLESLLWRALDFRPL